MWIETEEDLAQMRREFVRDAIKTVVRKSPMVGTRPQIMALLEQCIGGRTSQQIGRELDWLIAHHQIGCARWSPLNGGTYPRRMLATVILSDEQSSLFESPRACEDRRAAAEREFHAQIDEVPALRLYRLRSTYPA